ncbi:(2Fe-2S)-binding protein [Actinoplanes sp. NPDC026670]|uniref:(2Fe-2S)-binding protein n=1 Tax=Actinoplanes sp. NPDC026670 TaxID=3154700 RepID=UPI0033D9A240
MIAAVPALSAAASIGPYFVWERREDTAGWRPFTDLCDPQVLASRVDIARQTLATMGGLPVAGIAERVVASTVFLGLAARLVSPPLAAAVAGAAVPLPDTTRLWWRPVDGGPMPIAHDDISAVPCTGQSVDDVAALLTATVVGDLVTPVLEVFRSRFRLSPQVLWGNVASAFGGAAAMIADTVPGHAAGAAAVVTAMLGQGLLAGTAAMHRPDPGHERWFLVRRSCCLYYRIPGGGTCGDCVLTPEQTRREQWRSVLARRRA